ncbi:MAG TPA: hypothetical protein VMI32_15470 [Candidatus Solibacter sp.]|nr:hypothetical protein [Candidatus Solibacter sp.]
MSTQSVDRFAVASENNHFPVTQENHPPASTPQPPRSATSLYRDRSSLCTFTFSDGRHCRAPLSPSGHPSFCRFHAKKDAQARAADELGRDVSYFFSGAYLSAGDLSAALGRLFAAVAAGNVKPKTAATLAYLGQTLLQTIHMAQNEYIRAFGETQWQDTLRKSVNQNYAFRQPRQENPPQEAIEDDPAPSFDQIPDELPVPVQAQEQVPEQPPADSHVPASTPPLTQVAGESPKPAPNKSTIRPANRSARQTVNQSHTRSSGAVPGLLPPAPGSAQPAQSPTFLSPS